jgi:hypothetical protein
MKLPEVLEMTPEPGRGRACNCLCAAGHGGRLGVCAGWIEGDGIRLHFNSMYATEGVLICRPCAKAYPEKRP